MTKLERIAIHVWVDSVVASLRRQNPDLAPAEIYYEILEEIDVRCQSILSRDEEDRSTSTGKYAALRRITGL